MVKDSERRTKEVLNQYAPLINKIVRGAFADELNVTSDFSYRLNSLGHSIIMNNFMIDNATKFTPGENNFRMYKIDQANYFMIRDEKENFEIHGKFKKLKKNYCSSNIPTQMVLKFLQQEALQYELPFMPDRVNIIIGYLPNQDRTDIEVYVTCPTNENHLAWIFPVPKDGEQNVGTIGTLVNPVQPSPTKRVEPNTITQKEQSNEGNN
jgi:hypothetical protein